MLSVIIIVCHLNVLLHKDYRCSCTGSFRGALSRHVFITFHPTSNVKETFSFTEGPQLILILTVQCAFLNLHTRELFQNLIHCFTCIMRFNGNEPSACSVLACSLVLLHNECNLNNTNALVLV